jgi:hypothetical protein
MKRHEISDAEPFNRHDEPPLAALGDADAIPSAAAGILALW